MSDFWQETTEQAVKSRKYLHAHPELGWQERNTAEFIRNYLTQLNIPWRACANTGTVARLEPVKNSSTQTQKTIALRGDIDALPILEKSNKPWQSTVEGCMHACGHDGHTATLLATAQWLAHHRNSLTCSVVLIFQPAEEGGHGAREMIDDGALDGVDEIYGWHNWPAIPFGKMACPDGLVMCGNGTFTLKVNGKGGHASQPELCADPVLAASAIHLALQQIISRRIAPREPVVVSVTSIEALSGPTITPDSAILSGSIRVPNPQTRSRVHQLISEIATSTAQSYGVSCDVHCEPRYEATINHSVQAENMRAHWLKLNGADSLAAAQYAPVMASEDFSYYLAQIPGAFALIGADDGPENQLPCHNSGYDFNDRLIPLVTKLYGSLCGLNFD